MTDILVVVVLWQVVLVGLWGVSRRVRRLERGAFRPACYPQVVALRENVAGMRADVAEVEDEQAHWVRSIVRSIQGAEDELDDLTNRFEHFSRLLLHQMAQIEKRLADDDPHPTAGLPLVTEQSEV
jgi:hypothetical protein